MFTIIPPDFFSDFICAMCALARFKGLTVVLLKIQVFWDVMLCCWGSSCNILKDPKHWPEGHVVRPRSVSEWGEDAISLCRQDDLDGGQWHLQKGRGNGTWRVQQKWWQGILWESMPLPGFLKGLFSRFLPCTHLKRPVFWQFSVHCSNWHPHLLQWLSVITSVSAYLITWPPPDPTLNWKMVAAWSYETFGICLHSVATQKLESWA